MTVLSDEIKSDFQQALIYGEQVRFIYYNQFNVGEYDDDVSLTHMTGSDTWSSGVVQNIGGGGGFRSNEAFLLEQGKLLAGDKRLYVAGSHQFSGAAFKIGLGSPSNVEYRVIDNGIIAYPYQGSDIYQKLFIRVLTNGSLTGE